MITLLTAHSNKVPQEPKAPWFLDTDLKYLSELVKGSALVMGKQAWAALPKEALSDLTCQIWIISNPIVDSEFRQSVKKNYPNILHASSLDVLKVVSPPRSQWYVIGDRELFDSGLGCADCLEITIISNSGHTSILDEIQTEHDWVLRLSHPHPYYHSLRCIRYERQPRSRREAFSSIQV